MNVQLLNDWVGFVTALAEKLFYRIAQEALTTCLNFPAHPMVTFACLATGRSRTRSERHQ